MDEFLDQLLRMPLAEIARAIRARRFSSSELVQAQLRRIELLNPRLKAVVAVAPDALELARAADQALARGDRIGPLHGIPLSIKDTIETKGLRTTSGSLVLAGHVPREDAVAVARLKSAGALIICKTNVSEMAMSYDAANPVYGRTNNPHDLRLTPGGSSGGEAAAIAAGLSLAGLGSDLSGSVRVPAHFCGIAGLKPTVGVLPGAGQCPPSIGPFSLGAVIGPMARHVSDLATLFDVLSRPETELHEEAAMASSSFASSASESGRGGPLMDQLRGCRVAWYADDGVTPVTEETRLAVESAARAFGDAGFLVEESVPPGIERGPDLWSSLFSRAALHHVREIYAGREDVAGPIVRAVLKRAASEAHRTARDVQERDADAGMTALDQFIGAWKERDRLREALIHWMNSTPLILAPVGAMHAFEHDARRLCVAGRELSVFRAFGYSQAFNVYDLPAVCVPVARTREGLPIGVQVVGRPFAEATVLAAALILERAFGGWQPPSLALSHEGDHPL